MRVSVRGLTRFAWAAALVATAGCAENPVSYNAPTVTLRMQQDSVQLSAIGKVQQLATVATDASGRVVDPPPLDWASDNPGTVSVDQSGTITALRDGDANITVTGSIGSMVTAMTHVVVRAGVIQSASISSVVNPLLHPSTASSSVTVTVQGSR